MFHIVDFYVIKLSFYNYRQRLRVRSVAEYVALSYPK